ncbi:hypothetical protein D3C85_1404720 [compost metagenome]
MHSHLLTGNQLLADRLHKLHEVAELMEHPQVRIYDDDSPGPLKIGAKQLIEGHTALVLLDNQMLRLQLRLVVRRDGWLNRSEIYHSAIRALRRNIIGIEEIQLRDLARHPPVVLVWVLPLFQGAD